MPRWIVILAALVFAILWLRRETPPLTVPPGVLAPRAPSQASPSREAFAQGDYTITPLADFSLSARVLSRADYHFGTETELSPTDLALGWGAMSDTTVLAGLDISQSGRWYHYRWGSEGPPIPPDEIVRSSANMHLIPANDQVADVLDSVRAGQVVALKGALVEAVRNDGWRWRSSLTREDSGNGACEVIWVEDLRIER